MGYGIFLFPPSLDIYLRFTLLTRSPSINITFSPILLRSMAHPPDYEPSIAPAGFAAAWREKFSKRPRQPPSIYSLPDDDCSFEYDDQPLFSEAEHAAVDGTDRQRARNHDHAVDTSSLFVPSDLNNLDQHSPEVTMALAGTFIRQ